MAIKQQIKFKDEINFEADQREDLNSVNDAKSLSNQVLSSIPWHRWESNLVVICTDCIYVLCKSDLTYDYGYSDPLQFFNFLFYIYCLLTHEVSSISAIFIMRTS